MSALSGFRIARDVLAPAIASGVRVALVLSRDYFACVGATLTGIAIEVPEQLAAADPVRLWHEISSGSLWRFMSGRLLP